MADINITSKYLNQDKREAEAITVTLPAVANIGGGRTNKSPTYNKYGDKHIAYVVPKDSIIQKIYLDVEEAFPAGSVVVVNVGGTEAIAVTQVLTAQAFVVSATEDLVARANTTIDITVTGGGSAGADILTGKLNVIVETIPYKEKNGRYSSYAHANDATQAR